MLSVLKNVFWAFSRTSSQPDVLQRNLKVLTAGLRTYEVPPDFSDVVLPDRPKLKFLNKVPNFKKAKKEMKRLRDIQGPAKAANTFNKGQYGIVALGGGYLHWGHMEMMRLTINRRMDPRTTFARWRINAPYKPITRKGLGQRMGGGKGAIDHYVTPVKCGRLIIEVGGRVELGCEQREFGSVAAGTIREGIQQSKPLDLSENRPVQHAWYSQSPQSI
ncbi:39S ribosomal protein L16, mitochondrial isoform X2 [Myxocyprinus asiaticus]|uniref:39S ribosomal protein L16, mitochondrial isoform X2 n=1 Tax=Myxocyprinus asiaticus TaxID=70543 RepID=UPI002221A2DD|nr:39S ribosomal protein L16, mitochondrial isoform X2 [Myxocyprinus asiaticus]